MLVINLVGLVSDLGVWVNKGWFGVNEGLVSICEVLVNLLWYWGVWFIDSGDIFVDLDLSDV